MGYLRYGTHIIWCSAMFSFKPLLFLIHINDMPNIMKYYTPIIFADDTNLIFSSKSFDILQTNIQDDLII